MELCERSVGAQEPIDARSPLVLSSRSIVSSNALRLGLTRGVDWVRVAAGRAEEAIERYDGGPSTADGRTGRDELLAPASGARENELGCAASRWMMPLAEPGIAFVDELRTEPLGRVLIRG